MYAQCERVLLVSSFVASLFLGRYAPLDHADASGMNMMHLVDRCWVPQLLQFVASSTRSVAVFARSILFACTCPRHVCTDVDCAPLPVSKSCTTSSATPLLRLLRWDASHKQWWIASASTAIARCSLAPATIPTRWPAAACSKAIFASVWARPILCLLARPKRRRVSRVMCFAIQFRPMATCH
jgi:hypothetical protein